MNVKKRGRNKKNQAADSYDYYCSIRLDYCDSSFLTPSGCC